MLSFGRVLDVLLRGSLITEALLLITICDDTILYIVIIDIIN